MPVEPAIKRVVTFVDGQNLFHAVHAAFGYSYPNYDIQTLFSEPLPGQGLGPRTGAFLHRTS